MNSSFLTVRRQQVLYDKKWKKFLKRAWLFRYIPFVEFALAAGSMATGNVREESDFDVIIGARAGRIFTARFLCVAAFELFGWRRRREHFSGQAARDKICLNHFVTPAAYRLAPPHNAYWQNLYQNLVPLYGETERVRAFWRANADWLGVSVRYNDDLRHRCRRLSLLGRWGERLFSGGVGDWLEKMLKRWQVAKIEKSLSTSLGFKPRIIYTDSELEFHPDTARTEQF